METLQCKTCGGVLTRNGNYNVCRFCGNKWTIDVSNDVHVVDRANAWSALRDNDFERAVELFENILIKEPENHEACWGLALSSHGIMYVTDLNENKKVPTCNNISENSFVSDKWVQKAISLAPADIAATYRKQAEDIEKIRLEWLDKARKEPPYDIFISFKDSDREHGIERTQDSIDAQDLYNALIAAGYKVFFSRISLKDKISEQYEPYIYNAIKTAKVMIVFGERPEYFSAVWIKNEWTRFKARIESGEKHKNSLVVAYKNMDPSDLPAVLKKRQCMNASDMTFLTDLKRHIERVIEESRQAAHLDRIKIQGGQMSKKAGKIANATIQTREIGEGTAAETSVSEKQRLEIVKSYIKVNQWKDAQALVEEILLNEPNYAEALLLRALISRQAHNFPEWLASIKDFTKNERGELEKILNYASKEYAAELLDTLYGASAKMPEGVALKILETVIPYNYQNRDEWIRKSFDLAIEGRRYSVFELLLSTLSASDVDAYIEYCLSYARATNDQSHRDACVHRVLEVDAGNIEALRMAFGSTWKTANIELLTKSFEEILKYSTDINSEVLYVLTSICNELITSTYSAFAKQALKYYTGDLKNIADVLLKLAYHMLASGFFDDAKYIFNLILTLETYQADVYWGLCLVNVKARDEREIINSRILLKECPEYIKYLSVVDEKRREQCIKLAKYQEDNITKKRKDKIVSIVSVSIMAGIILAAIVSFFIFESAIKYNYANQLFAERRYDEAMEIYSDLSGYSSSDQYVAVIEGTKELNNNLDGGIKTILSSDISVNIEYVMNGGTFETEANAEIVKKYFNSYANFQGVETPSHKNYEFLGWEVAEWGYDGDRSFKIRLNANWNGSEGLEYTLSDDASYYSVSGIGDCRDFDIAISDKYNGLPVKAIEDSAFYHCTSLMSVIIPDSVKSIGDSAFSDCYSLASITIPDSVISIGKSAFHRCTSLTSVTIPDSVTSISPSAFSDCYGLTSIIIPDGVTSIGSDAFKCCTNLTTINYRGTEMQWDTISKGYKWDYKTGNYTIIYNYTEE